MTQIIEEFTNRESLLSANSALIKQLQARLKAKRFRPQEGDNVRIGYIRALIQALQCQAGILKDSEIDNLKQEFDSLKEALKCRSLN